MFSARAIGILAAHVVTVANAQEGGWRHDDDLVLEVRRNLAWRVAEGVGACDEREETSTIGVASKR